MVASFRYFAVLSLLLLGPAVLAQEDEEEEADSGGGDDEEEEVDESKYRADDILGDDLPDDDESMSPNEKMRAGQINSLEIKNRHKILMKYFAEGVDLEAERAKGEEHMQKFLKERYTKIDKEDQKHWNQLQADHEQIQVQSRWRQVDNQKELLSAFSRPQLFWDAESVAERVAKYTKALDLGILHLGARLDQQGPFGGFEILMPFPDDYAFESEKQKKAAIDWPAHPEWTHNCVDFDKRRITLEQCVIQQLQALSSLCGAADVRSSDKEWAEGSESERKIIISHLKAISSGKLPTLGIKKEILWIFDEKLKDKKNDNQRPELQALILGVMLKCAAVVKKPKYIEDAEGVFQGLYDLYNPDNFLEHKRMLPSTAWMILRAVAEASLYAPSGSQLATKIEDYTLAMEKHYYAILEVKDGRVISGNHDLGHAFAMRYRSGKLTAESKKRVKVLANGPGFVFASFIQKKRAIDQPTFLPCPNMAALATSCEITQNTSQILKVFHYIDQLIDDFQMTSPYDLENFEDFGDIMEGGFNYWVAESLQMAHSTDCLDSIASALRMLKKLPKDMDSKTQVLGLPIGREDL